MSLPKLMMIVAILVAVVSVHPVASMNVNDTETGCGHARIHPAQCSRFPSCPYCALDAQDNLNCRSYTTCYSLCQSDADCAAGANAGGCQYCSQPIPNEAGRTCNACPSSCNTDADCPQTRTSNQEPICNVCFQGYCNSGCLKPCLTKADCASNTECVDCFNNQCNYPGAADKHKK